MHLFKKIFITLAAIAPFFFVEAVHAANASDFQAGRIIDDQVFFDANALSASQIQSFLFTQVQTCDSSGNQIFTGYYNGTDSNGVNHSPFAGGHSYTSVDNIKRAQLDNRYPAPYTCLKDYLENTSTHANNIGNPIASVSGGISAAQIIYNEAQNYSISPKVLLVLVQKESSLVTDDWPWPNEYKTATGYGCPDTAVCDSAFFGFYNQVHKAALQYRLYANTPNNYNFVIGTNSILEHPVDQYCPNPAHISVNIVNQATAGLYNYTPYTPNAAAMSNLYGSGNSCSAYGNRNFWRLYTDWFGSTFIPSYASKYISQSGYPTLIQGQSISAFLSYQNVGANSWYDNSSSIDGHPVRLSTSHFVNRSSTLGSSWGGDRNRPTGVFAAVYESDGTTLASNQHVAGPGQIARFNFTLSATTSSPATSYQEFFQPIVEGISNMNDPYTFLSINVQNQVYSSSYAGQSGYPALIQSQSTSAFIKYKNTGNMAWYDNQTYAANGAMPVHLSTSHSVNRSSALGTSWGGDHNRPTGSFGAVYESDGMTLASNQHIASPGQIARFDFALTTTYGTPVGSYREFFQPLVEGGSTMNDPYTFLDITVATAKYSSQYFGQSNYPVVPFGGTATAYLSYKNTGNLPWYDGTTVPAYTSPVILATSHAINRKSNYADMRNGGWCGNPDQNRAACTFAAVYRNDGTTLAPDQHSAQPGEIVKFGFNFAGTVSGTSREFFQPIVEGYVTMLDPWTYLDITVQ